MGENSLVQWFIHQEEKLIGIKESLILGGSTVAGPAGAIGGLLLFMIVENMGEGFLRIGEKGIEIAEDKIKEAKIKGGRKAELAKLAEKFLSPGLNLTKSFFNPEALKNIFGNKDGSVEGAKKFFNELSKNEVQKKAFEDEILKFLTGRYKEKEFEKEIKDKFGIKIVKEALDLYLEFRDFIFNDKVEKTLAEIIAKEEGSKKEILSELNELKEQAEQNLKKLEHDIFTLDEGFSIITPVYFYYHKSKGINDWKEGWKPRLEDAYANLDYKRKIIGEIENEGNFLILGESGYSKSTTLYRIICDFYEKYYAVVASLDGGEIERPEKIVKVIEGLLTEEKNVLVAVDNVQDKMRAFDIIYNLATRKDFERMKFVFTARLPDFKDIIQTKKHLYGDYSREAINYSLAKLIAEVPIVNFDIEEAEGFVRKFYSLIGREFDENSLKKDYERSNNGHPILFKYWITGESIESDVDAKYHRYIFDRHTEKEDGARLRVALFSCILDSCGVKITKDLADKCKVDLSLLKDSILKYNEDTKSWETMHHVWNIQFFKFWDSLHRKKMDNHEEIIKQIVDTIVDLKNGDITFELIKSLADIVGHNKELIELFKPSIKVPDYLNDFRKAYLYTYSLGLMHFEIKDFDKSLEANTKAIEIFEKNMMNDEYSKIGLASAYNNRGIAYHEKGDLNEAIQDCNKAIKIHLMCQEQSRDFEGLARAYYNRASSNFKNRDVDKAIQDYNNAIEINPRYAAAYNKRGLRYNDKGDLDKAIQDYSVAIEINPRFTDAYNNRGSAYFSKRDLEKAVQDFNTAIEINPKDAQAFYNRGTAYGDKGYLDKAIQDFKIALEINPKHADAYNNRGFAYLRKGDLEKAIQDYNIAIEINPKNAQAYYNRAAAYVYIGDLNRANHDENKAKQLDKLNKAIEEGSKAIKTNSRDAQAYIARGIAYRGIGDFDACVVDWANAGFLWVIQREAGANMALEKVFSFNNSENKIKYEAGVALAAVLKIFSLLEAINRERWVSGWTDDEWKRKKFDAENKINEILTKIKEKEPTLSASAKAVLTEIENGEAEIWEIKDFKDEAFAFLLRDLKKNKTQLLKKQSK